mmetsp:Transcript_21585/g.47152  ORF Transcript_21585/g.47152 Transcript_21585/m.47152 type:complete len:275 (+) Transcript_21585:640-1464(+)
MGLQPYSRWILLSLISPRARTGTTLVWCSSRIGRHRPWPTWIATIKNFSGLSNRVSKVKIRRLRLVVRMLLVRRQNSNGCRSSSSNNNKRERAPFPPPRELSSLPISRLHPFPIVPKIASRVAPARKIYSPAASSRQLLLPRPLLPPPLSKRTKLPRHLHLHLLLRTRTRTRSTTMLLPFHPRLATMPTPPTNCWRNPLRSTIKKPSSARKSPTDKKTTANDSFKKNANRKAETTTSQKSRPIPFPDSSAPLASMPIPSTNARKSRSPMPRTSD